MSELEETKPNIDLKIEKQTLNEPISLSISDIEETSSLVSDDSSPESMISQESKPIEQDLTMVDSASDNDDNDDNDDDNDDKEEILSHSPVPSSASEEDTDKSPIELSETDDNEDTDDEIESDMLKKL